MIIRARRETNYTILSNTGLNDDRLSFKAKGILAYLLSKPDGWTVSYRHLVNVGPEGQTSIRSGLKELEDTGYLVREKKRAPDGTFTGTSIVYDEPCVENRSLDNRSRDNKRKVSTEVVSTEVVNTYEEEEEGAAVSDVVGAVEVENNSNNDYAKTKRNISDIVVHYENEIGLITPIVYDDMREWLGEVPGSWIYDAISLASKYNKKSWAYVDGILNRSKAENLPPGGTGGAQRRVYDNQVSNTQKGIKAVDSVFDRLEAEGVIDGSDDS